MPSSATSDPSPFMLAQALRILMETGHPEPTHEAAGCAFVATMLNSGWGNQQIANAITAGFTAAGPQLSAKSAYTLMAYEQTGTKAVATFRRTFLESMRPGISERSEQKAKIRMTAAQPRRITNNVFSNAIGGFWSSLLLEPADDNKSRDEHLKKDLQQAVRAARRASSKARKHAKQQQAESL